MVHLQYPIQREYPWRWFAPASLAGATVVVAFLIVINIALAGYETVTVFSNDFNTTGPSFWFYNFMPYRTPKPGSLCDPVVFNIGDSFSTNYSYFQWTIDSVNKGNAGRSAIEYAGIPLSFCDVSSIIYNGDLYSFRSDSTVTVSCKTDDMEVTARTTFSIASLPGLAAPILGVTKGTVVTSENVVGQVLDELIRLANSDLGARALTALIKSNEASPAVISVRAQFEDCPLTLGLDAKCANQVPQFNITDAAIVLKNLTSFSYGSQWPIDPTLNPWVFDDDNQLPVFNIMQTIYAAVRIDLGNPSSNNFILNSNVTNATLANTFPATKNQGLSNATSALAWLNPGPELNIYLPLRVSGPATIQVPYPCRFQREKSFGSLLIAVVVATLSVFTSLWGTYLVLASHFARGVHPHANRCDGHCVQHKSGTVPSDLDVYDPYGQREQQPLASINSSKETQYKPLEKDDIA